MGNEDKLLMGPYSRSLMPDKMNTCLGVTISPEAYQEYCYLVGRNKRLEDYIDKIVVLGYPHRADMYQEAKNLQDSRLKKENEDGQDKDG
jgi:hypothetical protein